MTKSWMYKCSDREYSMSIQADLLCYKRVAPTTTAVEQQLLVMSDRLLKKSTNRPRRDADTDDLISGDPTVCSLHPDGPEYKFFIAACKISDNARETSDLLEVFLNLLGASTNHRIKYWSTLPLKNKAPNDFAGYSYVIRELFKILARIYKTSDPSVRRSILRALGLAEQVLQGRIEAVIWHGDRNRSLWESHVHVIQLWTDAIEELDQALEDGDRTERMKVDKQNHREGGGPGYKTERPKKDSEQTRSSTQRSPAPRPRCSHEYRGNGGRGRWASVAAGGVAAGGVAVTVCLTSMAAATPSVVQTAGFVGAVLKAAAAAEGAAKVTVVVTAIAASPVGQAVALLTTACGGPMAVAAYGFLSWRLLKIARGR